MDDNNNQALTSSEKQSILSILTDIIAIPSVKGKAVPGAPYGSETLAALQYMLDLGENNGFKVKNLNGRAGYIEWGSGPKMIGILCHLDVVPAGEGWNCDPFTLRHENGRLIGRGINDDKGPAVTVFYAMLRLKNSGYVPKCRIRLILGIDEECGSSCIEHYKEVEELPACGFTPDADFPAIYAEKGILQLRFTGPVSKKIRASAGERPNMVPAHCSLTFLDTGEKIEGTGITSHGSKPELGINAISETLKRVNPARLTDEPVLSFFMSAIGDDTTGNNLLRELPHDVSGALSANAGVLTMDDTTSELLLDIRYPVLSDGEVLFAEIREKAAGYGVSTEIYSHQKPLFKDPSEPLIKALLSVYEKHVDNAPFDDSVSADVKKRALMKPTEPIAIGGGTYARSMPVLVAFGPAFPWEKDQAHQINESMSEESIYLLVQIYQDALTALAETV